MSSCSLELLTQMGTRNSVLRVCIVYMGSLPWDGTFAVGRDVCRGTRRLPWDGTFAVGRDVCRGTRRLPWDSHRIYKFYTNYIYIYINYIQIIYSYIYKLFTTKACNDNFQH